MRREGGCRTGRRGVRTSTGPNLLRPGPCASTGRRRGLPSGSSPTVPAWWTVLRSPGHSNGPRLKMPASMGTRPIGWARVVVRTRPHCQRDGVSPKRRAAYVYAVRSASSISACQPSSNHPGGRSLSKRDRRPTRRAAKKELPLTAWRLRPNSQGADRGALARAMRRDISWEKRWE